MNNLTITGTVVSNLPTESGKTKAGSDWKKRTVIVQQNDQYKTHVAITLFGKAVDFKTPDGETITASVNVKSREYNNKWYTDIEAWKISSEAPNSQEKFAGVDSDDQSLPF